MGPGFRRDEWRADALARSGAGDFGKAGSFVARMAASFQAPRAPLTIWVALLFVSARSSMDS